MACVDGVWVIGLIVGTFWNGWMLRWWWVNVADWPRWPQEGDDSGGASDG